MKNNQKQNDQGISITLPIKINFMAIGALLHKELVGKTISKTKSDGKELKYFKILDLDLAKSKAEPYNLEINLRLQTLTLLHKEKDMQVTLQTKVVLDVETQRLYIDAYKIEKVGDSGISSYLLKSVLNTFIYRKVIDKLSVHLTPTITEKLKAINTTLASNLDIDKGISIIGHIENIGISHLEIKENGVWVFIDSNGWLILDIDHLAQ